MKLENVLAEVFSLSPENICDSLQLQDIQTWDSMTHMVMIIRLEEAFETQFSGDEIADIRSIGDIRQILDEKGKGK
jgi:acyl carrier protein